MDKQQLASVLEQSLRLDRPPVGLAFVEQPPASVQGVGQRAPSACTFWRRAEQGVFYASAADHTECPIGVLTMGFTPNESEQARAQETVGLFVNLDYFSMDEVAHLPSVKQPHNGIVYGPLAQLPVDPEVVLVVTSPFQAMLIAESGGTTALADVPQLAVMGRPACAAIPRSLDAHQTTMSLGCIGARTYAELPEDKMLVAIPAERLEPTVQRLQKMLNANDTLADMHSGKKTQFEQAVTA